MTRARQLADAGVKADYLDNVASDINTQLNAKAPLADPDLTGNVDITGNAPVLKLATNTNATNAEIQLHGRSSDGNPSANKVHLKSIAVGSDEATRFGVEVMHNSGGDMTERLSVLNSGNVGIGTTSPSNLLHLALGDSSNDNYRTGGDTPLIIEAGGSTNNWIQFLIDSTTYWAGILICDDATDSGEFGYMAGDGQCVIKSNGDHCFSVAETRHYMLRGYFKYAGYGRPDANNSYDWGTSGDRWKDVWCNQGAFNDSDINLKKDIAPSALGLDFINKLNPVSYKWKDIPEVLWKEDDEDFKTMVHAKGIKVGDVRVPAKTHKRTHYGLVAQEVVSTLDELGIDTVDFAAYSDGKASLDSDGNKIGEDGACALRYTEFISPMIKAIQELSAKVTALENA